MKKTKQQSQRASLSDKILDQSISLFISFVLTTALIGGGGYILTQYPVEKNAIDRKIKDYSSVATEMRRFNDMESIFITGWFADKRAWREEEQLFQNLTDNVAEQTINPTIREDVLTWINTTLPRLKSERGRIAGYILVDEVERSLQEDFLKQYDIVLNRIKSIDEMVRNWDELKRKSRDEHLSLIQDATLSSMENLQALISKSEQLRDQDRAKLTDFEQKGIELSTEKQVIANKAYLALTGIVIGLALAFFVGRAVIRKGAER